MPAQRRLPVALRQQTTVDRKIISTMKYIQVEFALALFCHKNNCYFKKRTIEVSLRPTTGSKKNN
jgi:hypothetical protein